MTAFGLADEATATVLDLTSPALATELAQLENRLHVLQGLLGALGRVDEVNKTVQFARDRSHALTVLQHEPFGYSRAQAEAVLDMPVSWQAADFAERLRAEVQQLMARRSGLRQHIAEVSALHWFG